MSDNQTVTVSIFDKDYQINCAPSEVKALQESAAYLDSKMREIKSGSAILGLDRLAVMAALNIANDFLGQTRHTSEVVENQKQELNQLGGKLDNALTRLRDVSS